MSESEGRTYVPLPAHESALHTPKGELLQRLFEMVRIRVFEEQVLADYRARRIPGFTHMYLGQEACAVGVISCLQPSDYITSTHRGHGHCIARGLDMRAMMAELYGRSTGTCKGRGGSMHIADFRLGMLGANGIVAGGLGLAVGAALSARQRKSGAVAVSFFGDGGMNKGSCHEAMNFAGVARLPVIFVCENNRYAQYTAADRLSAGPSLAGRAGAYGFPGTTVDGNDVLAVGEAAGSAIERARHDEGPSLLVLDTYRHEGHSVGDAEAYRTREEVETYKSSDPIGRFIDWLVSARIATESDIEILWLEAQGEVADAVHFAEASPFPEPSDALDFVFASMERGGDVA